jgi:hypothetical protein
LIALLRQYQCHRVQVSHTKLILRAKTAALFKELAKF